MPPGLAHPCSSAGSQEVTRQADHSRELFLFPQLRWKGLPLVSRMLCPQSWASPRRPCWAQLQPYPEGSRQTDILDAAQRGENGDRLGSDAPAFEMSPDNSQS